MGSQQDHDSMFSHHAQQSELEFTSCFLVANVFISTPQDITSLFSDLGGFRWQS
jgi:hypothetical protein